MNAFDNTNLVNGLCGGCECTGFSAAVSFSYSSGDGEITFTDASTYGAGDARKIVNVRVKDKNSKTIDGNIAANDGDDAVTLDVSTLDLSEGFELFATVVTTGGCISDGHYGRIGMTAAAAGSIGSWDKDSNNIIISNVDETDDDES